MNISAKTEYACLAVLQLSLHWGEPAPIRIRTIADAHGIPPRFLVQILLQLKAAGLVESTRGATGGYRLLREPSTITLAEVMATIDGPATEPTLNATVDNPSTATLLDAWRNVARVEQNMLEAITFADLAAQIRGRTEDMYYI